MFLEYVYYSARLLYMTFFLLFFFFSVYICACDVVSCDSVGGLIQGNWPRVSPGAPPPPPCHAIISTDIQPCHVATSIAPIISYIYMHIYQSRYIHSSPLLSSYMYASLYLSTNNLILILIYIHV